MAYVFMRLALPSAKQRLQSDCHSISAAHSQTDAKWTGGDDTKRPKLGARQNERSASEECSETISCQFQAANDA